MNVRKATIQIDIVSDVVCPWCVIGYYQLAAAARTADIALDVTWHPFELNPQMPPEGENLREHLAAKYGTTPEDSRSARARLTEMGAAVGFEFAYADDMRMWNTFQAHQLIDWAADQGLSHPTKLALFTAYFTERRNVSDADVLTRIATDLGMDGSAARSMLESEERSQSVRTHQRHWIERGIHSVPAMVIGERYLVSGAQGEAVSGELLEKWMAEQAA